MKILIITYYKDLNPGTVLQAIGVKSGLLSIFPNAEIEYLQTNYKKFGKIDKKDIGSFFSIYLNKFYNFLRLIKFNKFTSATFKESKTIFNYFDYDEKEFLSFIDNYDLVVIGSDTILERISLKNQIGVMWGFNNSRAKFLAFAASGDSCSENMKSLTFYNELKKRLDSFIFIGLRDDIIKGFLTHNLNIANNLIRKQPDPTYLLPDILFKLSTKKINLLSKLKNVAIFHFDRRFKYRKEFAESLKLQGYILITPEYDPSCDISFKSLTPFEWGALFNYCEVVFTERFHDTIFSLRHKKPVFTIDWNKENYNTDGLSKRSEILKLYNLISHHIIISELKDIPPAIDKINKSLKNFDPAKVDCKNKELINLSHTLLDEIKHTYQEIHPI